MRKNIMRHIFAAICRYFEATADKRARELAKTYAYDCMTPEEHNAVLASVSRLPHALPNAALATMLQPDETKETAPRLRAASSRG
jgi:prephenate dehydrogenase